MIKEYGVQLFTIRDAMTDADAIRKSFMKLRELGYTTAQTGGCQIPYDQFGKIAAETGLSIIGTHDNFDLMYNDTEKAMENHNFLNTKLMGIGGYGLNSLDDIKRFVEKANTVADRIYKYGFKFTYHNHSGEFRKIEGKTIMQWLAEGLDPEKTSFCLDTYWVQHGGGDVRHWIEMLSGRIDILHLKDMGRNDQGAFITEIGNGNLYFPGIVEAAEKAGVKYYIVEQDTCPGDPFDSLKFSAEYIKTNLM